jgi:octaprenyl-diphosphate synthase
VTNRETLTLTLTDVDGDHVNDRVNVNDHVNDHVASPSLPVDSTSTADYKFHRILKLQSPRRRGSPEQLPMFDAGLPELLDAASRPAARPSAAALLPGAQQAEGIPRLERALMAAARQSPRDLTGAAVQLVSAGGKRVRPLLLLLSARACSQPGRYPRGRVALALASELIHSATLLHDDVIDDGLTRRGRPAPRVAYGNGVSVIAGDWLLTTSLDLALRSRVPGAVEAMVRTLRELVEGEAIQLRMRGDADFTAKDARRISRLKTASLFGFCGEAGAMAAGASDTTRRALRDFGLHCGLAFQIADDLLDFEADAATLGKAVLADVAEGKASLPVALALDAEPELRVELRSLLLGLPPAPDAPADAPSEEARVRAFAAHVARTGGLANARAEAAQARDLGLAALAHLPPGGTRDLLAQVASLLLDRRR